MLRGVKTTRSGRAPLTVIQVASLDDSRNRLDGLDYDDRMAIVFAAGTVLEHFVPETDSAEHRCDYFAWVGLTILLKLVRKMEVQWGEGQPGKAVASKDRAAVQQGNVQVSRLPSRRHSARQPDRLLLNLVRPDLVPPQYRDANYPVAIRQCRDELFQRSLAAGLFVPTLRLCTDIVYELHRLAGVPAQNTGDRAVESLVASQRAFMVPGVKAPVTARSIALVLEYYGVATPARSSKNNGYRVRPWDLRRLMALWDDHRIIQLPELTWMEGRYLVAPDPHVSSPPGSGSPSPP